MQKAARITAQEVAGTGMHWAFAPCVAVVQNERWGRTYESFGETPDLVSSLGAAAVRGLRSRLPQGNFVLGCAKHFIGDGGTQDGIDQGNTVCDEATLRELFLPPYQAAIREGVGSIMVSSSAHQIGPLFFPILSAGGCTYHADPRCYPRTSQDRV